MASVVNKIMANRKTKLEPRIGMGVTVIHYSDRQAGTVVDVHLSGKKFYITLDKVTRVDDRGMSDAQDYIYEPQPHGPVIEVWLNKHGQWKTRKTGYPVSLGHKDYYHDYSF